MGQSPPGSTYNEVGQGIPFYQGVKDFGSRYPTKRVYCTAPTRIAEKGDILFSVRAPIGSINRTNEKCSIGRGLSVIRAHNGDDFDFIEHLLKSMKRNWGAYESQGAIFGNARRRDLEELQIVWPPNSVRVQIASILSAYDDLIENNRRRIQLLEQAARLLYREWFVYLRFPGHEHVSITDGVPDGWEKKQLSEIADITMGQSPKSIYYNEDGNGLPFHQGVTNFGVRFPSHQTYCTVQNRLAEPRDILFSVRAPVGRINITTDKIVIGRGLSAIRSKLGQQNILFYVLKNHFFKEDMMGGGAIFAAITKKDLHGIELMQASDRIAEMFMKHVHPIDLQIENLQQTIDDLTQARNLLLPRLMNGEVAV
jgi:type I restriction enzyme S subunit